MKPNTTQKSGMAETTPEVVVGMVGNPNTLTCSACRHPFGHWTGPTTRLVPRAGCITNSVVAFQVLIYLCYPIQRVQDDPHKNQGGRACGFIDVRVGCSIVASDRSILSLDHLEDASNQPT